nr:hypothetical protein [Tanacetum cinerariifolium]
GSENRPPILNKENYVSWSSRLLWYAKSRPNGKLIHNSIINGPYVRPMIPEPGDTNCEVHVNETFHVQTDDELTEKELKQIEADDQAIQTIHLGLPEDIYAAVDSYETAQEIWLRVQQMMKGSDIGIQEKKANEINIFQKRLPNQKEVDELKAKRLVKTQDPLALTANSINPYAFPAPHQDQPSFNQNYMQQLVPNPEDITDPTTAMNMALTLMAKAFKLNYSTPTNNNQRISSNPRNRQIAQPDMNMGQDGQMQMVGSNGENQFRQYAGQNNPRVQNVGNQNKLIGVPRDANQNGNGNLVAARAEGNATGHKGNQIRCYNCRGTDKAPVYDSDGSAEYTELLKPIPESHQVPHNDNNVISKVTSVEQSGKTVEQHPANVEETRALYDSLYQNLAIEVERVNTQASTSGTQTDKAPVYDSDGSAEVHNYEDCCDNELFNMFTQEEQYTELLEPIPEPHQVPQNDNNVISEATSMEQSRGTVEQHSANVEETRVLYDTLYHNLAIEVEKVNTVNRKLKETNVELTTELARF